MNDICGFFGEYRFLSNFYPSFIEVDGRTYSTVEHFFQASKASCELDHEYVRTSPTPGIAKHRGKRIPLRSDWDSVKIQVMLDGLIAKFEQNPDLGERLARTSPRNLVEDNTWDDNNLGKLLMFVRETFI